MEGSSSSSADLIAWVPLIAGAGCLGLMALILLIGGSHQVSLGFGALFGALGVLGVLEHRIGARARAALPAPAPAALPAPEEPADIGRPAPTLEGADLSGASLVRMDLSGSRCAGAIMSKAMLTEAVFAGADLSGADLSGADLTGADLTGARARGVRLIEADLTDANLAGAALSGAMMFGANLEGANLKGADLTGADLTGVSHNMMTTWPAGMTPPAANLPSHEEISQAYDDHVTVAPGAAATPQPATEHEDMDADSSADADSDEAPHPLVSDDGPAENTQPLSGDEEGPGGEDLPEDTAPSAQLDLARDVPKLNIPKVSRSQRAPRPRLPARMGQATEQLDEGELDFMGDSSAEEDPEP
jgi:hypothetical protein